MKATSALLLATALSSLLSACGTALPQPMQLRQPVHAARAAQTLQARNFRPAYYNLVMETSYEPDVNGQQFGFDFGHVNFISARGRTMDLTLRYSRRGRILWIALQEQGAPQDQIENVGQSNRTRLAEVARELRALGAGTPQDKANIDRIAGLLENPPLRP